MQLTAGTLEPTPRGSNPTQSYARPALFGMYCPSRAMPRPEPPGPPGFASMMPWKSSSGTVCLIIDSASWIFVPCGLSWSSGTLSMPQTAPADVYVRA
jgi:hypothetical protein